MLSFGDIFLRRLGFLALATDRRLGNLERAAEAADAAREPEYFLQGVLTLLVYPKMGIEDGDALQFGVKDGTGRRMENQQVLCLQSFLWGT